MSKRFEGAPPPTLEQLEEHYDKNEVEYLFELTQTLKDLDYAQRIEFGRQSLRELWPDDLEYIAKTTWITRKDGPPGLLTPNFAQQRFWEDVVLYCRKLGVPIRGIILKARQLGFSTFIQAFQLAMSSLYQHRNSLTVSYDNESTQSLISKASFAFNRLWYPLPTKYESKTELTFEEPHGSSFQGITSGNQNLGRGFTFHHVHCSEIPFWQDAITTLAGMSQAVPKTPSSSVFWESTAQGMVGPFYDGWKLASDPDSHNPYVAFFAPWFWDPNYSTPFINNEQARKFMQRMSPADQEYQKKYGLKDEQMHWRAQKIAEAEMTEQLFRQEYPACAEEAFLTSGSPVFDAETVLTMGMRCIPPMFQGNIVLETEGEFI